MSFAKIFKKFLSLSLLGAFSLMAMDEKAAKNPEEYIEKITKLLKNVGKEETIHRLIQEPIFDERSVFHVAARTHHIGVAIILEKVIEARKSQHPWYDLKDVPKEKQRWTRLHFAASTGYVDIVRAYLEPWHNIVEEQISQSDLVPRYVIDLDTVKENPYLEYVTPEGDTALILAARYGHVGVFKLLLQSGANIYAINLNNWTALHEAAWNGFKEILDLGKTTAGPMAQAMMEIPAKMPRSIFEKFNVTEASCTDFALYRGHFNIAPKLIDDSPSPPQENKPKRKSMQKWF